MIKNITIKYIGHDSQKLGTIDNKPFIIFKNKEKHINEDEWNILQKNKWVQKLIQNNILIIKNKKSSKNDIDTQIEDGILSVKKDD